jgi:hypothetical protein
MVNLDKKVKFRSGPGMGEGPWWCADCGCGSRKVLEISTLTLPELSAAGHWNMALCINGLPVGTHNLRTTMERVLGGRIPGRGPPRESILLCKV